MTIVKTKDNSDMTIILSGKEGRDDFDQYLAATVINIIRIDEDGVIQILKSKWKQQLVNNNNEFFS